MNPSFPWLFPDSLKIPWLFPDFLIFFQNSLTFPWLEKVLSFFQVFQVFQCRWEPWPPFLQLAGVTPEGNLRITTCDKHVSKGSTLALKLRADITRSRKQGYQWPHKKDSCPPKNVLFFEIVSFFCSCPPKFKKKTHQEITLIQTFW